MTTPLPIVLDAFGGDNAPEAIYEAVPRAIDELDVDLILVGDKDAIAPHIHHDRVEIVHASEVIGMNEHPGRAVRTKKDSSIVRACELVAQGTGGAVVSAGNSGAILAASLLIMKRLPGVHRPAIGAAIPREDGGSTFLLDVGANSVCKPEWLAQFATMGVCYATTFLGCTSPRIGIVSNGEEEEKGTELIQTTKSILETTSLNLVGNVEGKDLFRNVCDVAVCDGFTGNVIIKTAEGVGEFLMHALKHAATSSVRGMIGGALLKPALNPLRSVMDYRHTGGALLLGINGEVVIAHGRSDVTAIWHAIRVAKEAMLHDVHSALATGIAKETLPSPASTTAPTKPLEAHS